jgi:hypothetical protein
MSDNKDLIKRLNDRLLSQLLLDLDDPTRGTPGLYTVIRGLINDNREVLDGISHATLDELEAKMASKAPFKFKAANG